MRYLLFLLILLGAGCIRQQKHPSDQIVLRLGHNTPTKHPYDLAARMFAERVNIATDGKVQIKIYPSSQLGDTGDQLEGLLLGTLDFSIAASSFASEFIPEFGIFSVPFLFEDAGHFEAVFDGRVRKMLDSLSQVRYRIRFIGALSSGDRAFFNSTRKVEHISDLSGLKVRVMSGKADALTWQAFGAIPTPMPYSELYSALQAGVIDGAENDPASILNNRFYETCPYLSLTNHLVLPMGIFASQHAFQRLTERQWAIILQEANWAAKWQIEYMEEQNKLAVQVMERDFGVTISQPDRELFMDRVKTLQDDFARELNAQELLRQVRLSKEKITDINASLLGDTPL